MRPKFFYRLSEEAIAHGGNRRCLTIQQRDPLFSERNQRPDRTVFLEPNELRKLRDALDDYLAEEIEQDALPTAEDVRGILASDSDTRPKDGDAKLGSTRE